MLRPSGPVQSSYTQFQGVAQVGMPASTRSWDADTRIAEDPAGDGIGFGLAVCKGTVAELAATLGALSGGAFLGITMADNTLANLSTATTDKYTDGENMGILTDGDIWVAPQTNVSVGGAVYFNSSTGQLGASGIANAVLIEGASWQSSYPAVRPELVATGRLAVVRLNGIR